MHWGFFATAFGGALVEFVEAAVILVAAAAVAGWAPALYGAAAAAGVLAVTTAVLGFALLQWVPLGILRAVIGALLCAFGVKWLAKATYRLGVRYQPHHGAGDVTTPRLAFFAAFNGVLLEGAEVVFIVLALGATGRALGSAIVGAAAALVLVALATAAARGPLAKVPEIILKYVVGIMLTSFGTLWLGEALHIPWWGSDASVIWLAAANLAWSLAIVAWVRRAVAAPRAQSSAVQA